MRIIFVICTALLLLLTSCLLFLPILPVTGLLLMLLWNSIMAHLDLPHAISYWDSIKLSFLIYLVKGLFSLNLTFSKND